MDDRLAAVPAATDERFDRIAGLSALGAAALSLIYAISYAVLKTPLLSAVALMAGGLLSAVALFAVYLGVLLVLIYLGRLIVLDPNTVLVLGPAAVTGLIVGPLCYGWVSWLLLKRGAATG